MGHSRIQVFVQFTYTHCVQTNFIFKMDHNVSCQMTQLYIVYIPKQITNSRHRQNYSTHVR